ncbi:bacterio-opsin activator [Halobiforma nitratireducens JCM 10879]|uniref:Bacterio-opsin activator n=1 Tax=Halobiforma nitratireducens JCM 10879 TaxID=1227454 RepID=M0LBW0_9EURY|nr:bacterio-opsin activator [Halobiforma nitratireducens JCM 10879]
MLVRPRGGNDQLAEPLERADCRVTTAECATTAVAKLSTDERGFDCLVSEYDLPGDDGLSLYDAVRDVDPTVPFVLVTDRDEEITSEAFDVGVDRVLYKNGSNPEESLTAAVSELAASTDRLGPQQDITGHEPEPEEIVRAIEDAPIGISLSDPSLPDNPLVYVNRAWEELTGYEEETVLGRNPRLLQGPDTDDEAIEKLANGIRDGEPTTVEIRNYRRDGTPFWNELTIAPIGNEGDDATADDEYAHYVGFQNDVSDRKAAEELAEERSERLSAERAALSRILGRVNGLVNEITRILVEERDRTMIAQRLCDEITDERGYTAGWIGTVTRADTGNGSEPVHSLRLTARAGVPDEVPAEPTLAELPNAVRECVETNDVAGCAVEDCDATQLGPASFGARRMAVVPLVYGRQRYGLLGVYADGAEALDHRERSLFESIGQMIASRLNALERTRILTADRVIEVEVEVRDESFPLSRAAEALGSEIEYVGLTTGPEQRTCELFLTTDGGVDVEDLTALSLVEDTRTIAEGDDEHTFAITVSSSSPFADLAEYGVSVDGITATPGRAVLTLELPPDQEVRSVLEILDGLYDQTALQSRHEHDRQRETSLEFASEVDAKLTERQHAALEAAHMNGYFEWPRPTDGSEIADTMGITRQTFHQHLRAAERKLVDAYLEC